MRTKGKKRTKEKKKHLKWRDQISSTFDERRKEEVKP